jgi:hypothetical protein
VPGRTKPLGSSPDEAMDPGSPSFIAPWGSQWAVSNYTVTVTCTRGGKSVSASKPVSIT